MTPKITKIRRSGQLEAGIPRGSAGENPTDGIRGAKHSIEVKLDLARSGSMAMMGIALIACMTAGVGCTRTADPDRAPNAISNNVPKADAAYTNQSIPTNQLQTNR